MRRLLLALLAAAALAAPAAAAPPVRLVISHVVSNCHVWSLGNKAAATVKVKPGARVEIRVSCPMDFDVAQTAGPKVALGAPRVYAGTARTIAFAMKGVYRFTAHNVQTPEERNLPTLGTPNTLVLTVVVR